MTLENILKALYAGNAPLETIHMVSAAIHNLAGAPPDTQSRYGALAVNTAKVAIGK